MLWRKLLPTEKYDGRTIPQVCGRVTWLSHCLGSDGRCSTAPPEAIPFVFTQVWVVLSQLPGAQILSGMFLPSCSHFCVRNASFYRLSRIKARISWKFHQVKGMDPVRLARCYLFILATWLGACCPTQHHQKRCFPEA